MMNHPNRDNDSFVGPFVILLVSVIAITIVILGFDGIAALFDMIG